MKITIENIKDFKPYLGKSKAADAGFDYIVENGDLYNDDDTIKTTIDKSLLLINKIVSENEPQKKTRKGKYTTAKGKYKITSRRKKGAKAEKKTDKTAKTSKSKKESKPKVGEAAPWQQCLRRFASMCGKERTVTSIRKFIREIHANFTAELKGKTPHIELIRIIRDKLLPKANSGERKVTLPQWDDLKKQCQAAAREWTVSKTVEKPEIKSISLSGLKKKKKHRSCR